MRPTTPQRSPSLERRTSLRSFLPANVFSLDYTVKKVMTNCRVCGMLLVLTGTLVSMLDGPRRHLMCHRRDSHCSGNNLAVLIGLWLHLLIFLAITAQARWLKPCGSAHIAYGSGIAVSASFTYK